VKDPIAAPARRFVDQVVLVTGAGGGIGSAIAERFAVEGAYVVVADVDEDRAQATTSGITEAGDRAETLAFDLIYPKACAEAVAGVVARRGRLDVLVNNAGVMRRGDLLAITTEDWALSFRVNLDAMFHLSRAVLPTMVDAGAGAIVNTASQWGLVPSAGHVAYNTSKAGVVSFTQSLARDYAPFGIRVNAVCPGEIHTPMLDSKLAQAGRTVADLDRLVPYGRIGRPAEVAALVAFLASDEAPYLCGAVVEITGAQAVG
jgi:2-hydroxycyclohexanecarboxyl-CoA dehydrogenase